MRRFVVSRGRRRITKTLELDFGPDLEAKLRAPRTLVGILAPAHKVVSESGMTHTGIDACLEKAIVDARRDRKQRA